MPGPQPSHSRDPPGICIKHVATRHNPGPGMLTKVMNARQTPILCVDVGSTEERSHRVPESCGRFHVECGATAASY
jgi:hypothetical protein